MSPTRLRRLLALIGQLQAGRGRNARELADLFGVCRRTIFRDLGVLREVGVPLSYDADEQLYRVARDAGIPPARLTTDEALTMIVLCQELGDGGQLPFYAAAQSAAAKLEASLPGELRRRLARRTSGIRIRLEPRTKLIDGGDAYRALVEAVAERRAVRIEYQSLAERATICTRLCPYRLLFSRRAWYVIGRSSLHRGTRTFHVGRIRNLVRLDETFKLPRGFSLRRYLRNAWHLIPEPGPDHRVVVRFAPQVAQNVAEVAWHRTQKTVPLPDGSLDFCVRVSGLSEISWWILGYGDQAEVLEPPALRELIAARAERIVARYRGRTERGRGGRGREARASAREAGRRRT